jgi:diguanylate cyclase (GGDEF)-like protein
MATPNQIRQSGNSIDQDETPVKGPGRRVNVRYPVVLDAMIAVAQDRDFPCQMHNFSMGGMLLQYRQRFADTQPLPIAVDDEITVHCVVPDEQGTRMLQFRARVVRTVQNGIGVAFLNPDKKSLHFMQRFALQFTLAAAKKRPQQAQGPNNENKKSDSRGRGNDDAINACNRAILATMDALLEQLRENLAVALHGMALCAINPDIKNDLLATEKFIKANITNFLETIRAEFKDRLRDKVSRLSDHGNSGQQPLAGIALNEMSLMGDEDLGAWLAVSDLTNKVEEANKLSMLDLEARLSAGFGMCIGRIDNPYSPVLFADALQAVLSQFKCRASVNEVCYTIVKEALIGLTPGLYDTLNGILADHGIQPESKSGNVNQSASSQGTHRAMNPSRPAGAMQSGKSHSSAAAKARDEAWHSTGSAHRVNGGGGMAAPHPESFPDIYRVVQELRDLRRIFSPKGSAAISLPQDGTPSAAVAGNNQRHGKESSDCYTTSELISAVADMQRSAQPFAEEASTASRVLASLDARKRAGSGKEIDPRDGNVLEVTGDLLHAMQNDPLVAVGVKPWLRNLELPIIKLALQDPVLFFDQSHIARQVVNSIAKLEFYQQGTAGSMQNSISTAIEELLEKIKAEDSDGLKIFSDVQNSLNRLIHIQEAAYAENLKDLVHACRDCPPIPEVFESDSKGEAEASGAEMRKWMFFARRLRQGDDVLYSYSDDKPQRLRVAWIDDTQTVYVFANLRGTKEKVLKVSDVARMIRLGIMEPQGNSGDSAMDRAQYSIMQNLYKKVVYESTHDSLTGLIDRREFSRRLADGVKNAKLHDRRHALVVMDIDQFGAINANCGYEGGDKLLRHLIDIIGKDVQGKGQIARLGGDEFGILFNECSLDDALAIIEKQIEEVANYKLPWEGNLFSVTLSVGIVPISVRSGSVDELMQAAELSCKIAKEAGGNRLQVFHAGHSRIGHQVEMKKWAAKVDRILEAGELEIRCQRIEPIDGGGSLRPHYEILLGLKDGQGNIDSPVEFIKGAELSHRMSTVDRYVITKTLAWMNDNAEIMEKFAGFAINLSGESLNEEGFVDFILAQLQGVRVPHEKICFEVTETVGINNLSDVALLIDRVKDTGCRFALDDFGSGMSSYGYLKNLPVDVVKIDGAFVKNLVADSSDYAVVRSITEIAHFMKKKVVAEYVESGEILDLLRKVGVDYAQGYMIDKPGSLDRLAEVRFGDGV